MPHVCSGVIENTFVVCGEGGNFCSEACMLRAVLNKTAVDLGETARKLSKLDAELRFLAFDLGLAEESRVGGSTDAVMYLLRRIAPAQKTLLGEARVLVERFLRMQPSCALCSRPRTHSSWCENVLEDGAGDRCQSHAAQADGYERLGKTADLIDAAEAFLKKA